MAPKDYQSVQDSDSHHTRHYQDDVTRRLSESSETTTDDNLHVDFNPHEHDETNGSTKWSQPVARWIPRPLKRWWQTVSLLAKGPDPPRIWKITPIFPQVQSAPLRLLDRYCPQRIQKIYLLVAFYIVFLITWATLLHTSAFAGEIKGYGAPQRLSCNFRPWRDKNGCGIDGNDCRPFENYTVPFRCPANCHRVMVLEPHAVGDQKVEYQSLVVGGPPERGGSIDSAYYRGDSFVCGAALHSGFLNNGEGGCGVLSYIGQQQDFPSVNQHGIKSIGFDSGFPLSFKFLANTKEQCKDLRWPLLAVTATFGAVLSVFTTSPAVFFWSIFTGFFFHVALVSDPPNGSDYYLLISLALGKFLPAAFVMYVMYTFFIFRTLDGLRAQFEKTILWIGACWVGALNNHTFDKIPIQRLTPHDLRQPGAIPSLIVVLVIIVGVVLGQGWSLRLEGRLPGYLALYGLMGAGLIVLVAVPNMNLRIHHYILGLLFIPGTALQNRPSLLYQGLLVGLFINGIARWGFDSILQTPGELRGDGQLGTDLPIIHPPIIEDNQITFTWESLPEYYDGLSVLVNDVERYRGYNFQDPWNFTWIRDIDDRPEYFRFGYMAGSSTGDFTNAGVWEADGSWTQMKPGAS